MEEGEIWLMENNFKKDFADQSSVLDAARQSASWWERASWDKGGN